MALMNNTAQKTYDEFERLTPKRSTGILQPYMEGVAPQPLDPIQLDDETQRLINEQAANAGADDIQEILSGIPAAKGLLQRPEQVASGARSLGMSLPTDFADTLAARSEKDFARSEKDLRTQAEVEKPMRQAKRYSMAADSFGKARAVEMNNFQIKNRRWDQKMAIEQANQQAKSSFLASVLGLVGTITGAVVAGPAGAAVGGAAGQVAGSQI